MPASPEVAAYVASLDLSKLVGVSGVASVTHKPGAVRLDGYPRLVYAPAQYGPGVRTEDVGAGVAEIAVAFAATPDADAVAAALGTTADHVLDAVRYAADVVGAVPTAQEG